MPPRDDDSPPSGRVGDDQSDEVQPGTDSSPGGGVRERARWILRTDHSIVSFVRELASSVLIVLVVGAVLFGVSGVWPPMVAVESGSMEPHLHPGDLVYVMDESRFVPSHAVAGSGVVSYESGDENGYETLGGPGDVIVFHADGSDGKPTIHRARFWVEEGENWYDRGDPNYLDGDSCESIEEEYCPAPHDGFITKGDANGYYDQSRGISAPVKTDWIRGTAEVRVPLFGCVRLYVDGDDNVPTGCLP